MTATSISAPVAAKDRLLRTAMRADAVLSGLAGVGIVALAGPLSEVTGLSRVVESIAGVGFVLYGLAVWLLARRADVRGAGIAVATANLAYTLLAVSAVVFGLLPLTGAGVAVVLASGVYTALFADVQYLAARRLRT